MRERQRLTCVVPPLILAMALLTTEASPQADIGAVGDATALGFIWPVGDPIILQVYACRACHPGGWPEYRAGINTHTGVDIRPAALDDIDYSVPVYAAADGRVESLVRFGRQTRGMGNSLILSHADGRYSLYGHLDSFEPGLSVGMSVTQGTRIGIMGNSGIGARQSEVTHVHFEIKDSPTVLDAPGGPLYMGYTPGHPDLYGYHDPRDAVEGIVEEPIDPVVTSAATGNALDVRGSPGEAYSIGEKTSIVDGVPGEGRFVASRKVFAEGRFWYFIHLPTGNEPLAPAARHNNGANGGWVDGDLITPAIPAASSVEVLSRRSLVRVCPSRSCSPVAIVHEGQLLAVTGSTGPGAGCGQPWYRIDLPESVAAPEGWVCGRSLGPAFLARP